MQDNHNMKNENKNNNGNLTYLLVHVINFCLNSR